MTLLSLPTEFSARVHLVHIALTALSCLCVEAGDLLAPAGLHLLSPAASGELHLLTFCAPVSHVKNVFKYLFN